MSHRSVSGLHRSARSVFASFTRDTKDEIQRARDRMASVKAHISEMQLILMMLMEKLFGIYTRAYVSSWDRTPTLTVSVWNAESFKDPRVLDSLAFLNGMFDTCDTEEYASALNREYRFKGEKFNVTLDVSVRSDSPTCRKVKVGEEVKTYTDTKYEIQCD